ncbi:MAG: succinate dehydrogenase, cytochrome b556 subunit [Rhizobiales bacterium 32-66-8]|nr:MAG: succinate dehydrogenase, cytochrome b556 subunit [Rhizobiales bacterium 32-66-8]
MVLLVWWLLAAASTPSAYATFAGVAGSWVGYLVLFGFTWALLHHALGGVRHFIWDSIRGFGAKERLWLAQASLAGSIVLTLVIWAIGLAVKA